MAHNLLGRTAIRHPVISVRNTLRRLPPENSGCEPTSTSVSGCGGTTHQSTHGPHAPRIAHWDGPHLPISSQDSAHRQPMKIGEPRRHSFTDHCANAGVTPTFNGVLPLEIKGEGLQMGTLKCAEYARRRRMDCRVTSDMTSCRRHSCGGLPWVHPLVARRTKTFDETQRAIVPHNRRSAQGTSAGAAYGSIPIDFNLPALGVRAFVVLPGSLSRVFGNRSHHFKSLGIPNRHFVQRIARIYRSSRRFGREWAELKLF